MINLDAKLTCPKCGRASAMRAFVTDEVKEIFALTSRFGVRWMWVEEYLRCFQSEEDKPLKPSRIRILLEEILGYVERQGFEYGRQFYAVRPDALFAAIREVAMKNKIGFKNHNYLKKVSIDFNLRMIQNEEKEQQQKAEEAMRRDPDGARKARAILTRLAEGDVR